MTSGIFSCHPVCRKGVKSCIVRAARSRPCSHRLDTLYKPGSKVCERSREPKPLKEAQTKFWRSQNGFSAKANIRTANVTRAKLTAVANTAQPSNPPAQPFIQRFFLEPAWGASLAAPLFPLNSREIVHFFSLTSSAICVWFKPAFFKSAIRYRCSQVSCLSCCG